MAMYKFPVYQPSLSGNEKKYVNDCLDSTWISSKGKYIEAFETSFAKYIGVQHAASVSNGTVAIHLALIALGIGNSQLLLSETIFVNIIEQTLLVIGMLGFITIFVLSFDLLIKVYIELNKWKNS